MSVEYICWYWIYHANSWGDECKLEGFCVPFGHRDGEWTFLENVYLYWIYAANNLGSKCELNMYVGIGYIMPTIGG